MTGKVTQITKEGNPYCLVLDVRLSDEYLNKEWENNSPNSNLWMLDIGMKVLFNLTDDADNDKADCLQP
jgi:hypothetical protein